MRRLLRVYARRLNSNLVHALRQLVEPATASQMAAIDGLYIRHALKEVPPDAQGAIALVEDYLDTKLAHETARARSSARD
jgi:TetR/AcrR family transcriptional regulator, transcriptional repressor of bet genes